MDKKIKFNLLQNSLDSLREALTHYELAASGKQRDERHYKHVVLNLSVYVELGLKYFIKEINPDQLYKKASKKKISTNKEPNNTITFKEAAQIIISTKEIIDSDKMDFKKNINWLVNTYNSIKHHEVNFSIIELHQIISKTLLLMDELYNEHGIDIANKIDLILVKDQYLTLLDEYNHEIKTAETEALRIKELITQHHYKEPSRYDDDDVLIFCPICANYTFVLHDGGSTYICTFCKHKDMAIECWICSKILPIHQVHYTAGEEVYFCSEGCLELDKKSKGCE